MNEKKKLTTRRIKKLGKKLNKINNKEEIAVILSNVLLENKEFIEEIEKYRINILNRKMDF